MDLYAFSEKYSISLQKARRMMEDGVLVLDLLDDPQIKEIRYYLGRRQPLSALQLCRLIEDPEALKSLGKHQLAAQEQLRALGDVLPAPRAIAACISDAASGDDQAIQALINWAEAKVPVDVPVTHHWLAVRLLLGLNPAVRASEAKKLPQAMLRLRKMLETNPDKLTFTVGKGKTSYIVRS